MIDNFLHIFFHCIRINRLRKVEKILKLKVESVEKKTIYALELSLSVLPNQEIGAGSKMVYSPCYDCSASFFSHDGETCYSISCTCDTGEEENTKAKLILDDCVAASRRQIKPLEFVCDVPLNE